MVRRSNTGSSVSSTSSESENARTGAELTSTMHTRLRGDEPGLVGYWRFDEGAGVIAGDTSPSRNDGALGYGLPDLAPEWVPSDAPITQ